MLHSNRKRLLCLLLILCSSLFPLLYRATADSNLNFSSNVTVDYNSLINSINMTNVQKHIETLSSLNSRVSGYSNSNAAAEYIAEKFAEYQLDNVYFENFTILSPFDYGANITIVSPESLTFKAYPLWPNLVETCETTSTGISGKLIYGGYGSFAEFNGKDVLGSIVLLEFNSEKNWLNAVTLGAKAIIFIAPENTTSDEAAQKSIDIPLDIPRLYVEKDVGDQLKNLLVSHNGEVTATITSKMRYEERQVSNVIGIVNGSDPQLKSEVIAVSAYYDSMSVVPSIAPGADETPGIAALLELARLLKTYAPERTFMLVALTGHNFALAGAREFADDYFNEIGAKIKLFVNLDLSTESDSVAAMWVGQFYQFDLASGRFTWISQRLSNDYMPMLYQLNDDYRGKFANALDASSWRNYVPRRFMLDSEPFIMAGGLGFSYVTSYSLEKYWDTPLDRFENLNIENLKPQLDIIFCTLYSFDGEEEILPKVAPTRFDPNGGGLPTLKGTVLTYNLTKGWYDTVPNALVVLQAQPISIVYEPNIVLMSNEKGEFVLKGALQSSVKVGIWATRFYTIQAYVDNPSSGPVEYATAFGKYSLWSSQVIIDKAEVETSIAVFKCSSIALSDTLNPFSMAPALSYFEVNNILTHAPPDFWGETQSSSEAIMFVPPNVTVEITMKSSDGRILAVLLNASKDNPEGSGYTIKGTGECLYLTHTPLLFVVDGMYQLTQSRIETAKSQGLRPISIENSHEKVTEYINQTYQALNAKQYDAFFANASNAWSLEVQTYEEIRSLIQNTINTTVFFFVLLIPFAFLVEGLVFSFNKGSRRLIAMSAIFGIFVMILYFVHPGFHLTSNIYMTLMGFVVLVLLTPALAIILGEAFKYLKETQLKIIGKHFTSISRLSALTTAFSIGTSNMKRRKLRTTLTLLTVILITFSMISFTSLFSFSIVRASEKSGVTLYDGVLIRTPAWLPLSNDLLNYLEAHYSGQALICPRSWLYASNSPLTFKLIGPNGSFSPDVVLGVTSREANLTKLDTLVRGSWESFSGETCIISGSTANTLGVDVNDTISWDGLNVTVVGIMDENAMKSRIDLDQESLSPLSSSQPGGKLVYASWSNVVIVPYDFAMDLGGSIRSIAIMPYDPNMIYNIASEIASVFTQFNVYAGVSGTIYYYIKGTGFTFQGASLIPVPLFISAFIMLNSMLGAVHERVKEIGIYSSIGLSPTHVAGLFVTESIAYAVIGAVLGYTLGIVGYPILIAVHAIPADVPLNYSSSWVIITLVISMAVTLLSTVYPVYKASRLVTPSIERVWKIPTKPKEDQWTIPLPFVVTTEKEALGILAFVKEYFEAHATERADAVFATKAISYQEEKKNKFLVMEVRLAPFEMGVMQETRVKAILSDKEKRYNFEVYLHRLEGHLRVWKTANRNFVDEVRKQLLVWRALKREDKEEYMKRAVELKQGMVKEV